MLLEGNMIERSWFEAQSAMAINLQSLTDEKNRDVQATDITVRWNRVTQALGPGLDYGCLFGEGKSGADALVKYAKDWSFVGNGCWDSNPGAAAFPAGNSLVPTQADVKSNADWSLSS